MGSMGSRGSSMGSRGSSMGSKGSSMGSMGSGIGGIGGGIGGIGVFLIRNVNPCFCRLYCLPWSFIIWVFFLENIND